MAILQGKSTRFTSFEIARSIIINYKIIVPGQAWPSRRDVNLVNNENHFQVQWIVMSLNTSQSWVSSWSQASKHTATVLCSLILITDGDRLGISAPYPTVGQKVPITVVIRNASSLHTLHLLLQTLITLFTTSCQLFLFFSLQQNNHCL